MARRLAPLLPLLLLAAALRFTGLSWGLRHRPQLDERFYVANVGHMLNRGDLDHGFYQYPGFFYYLLAPRDPGASPLSMRREPLGQDTSGEAAGTPSPTGRPGSP